MHARQIAIVGLTITVLAAASCSSGGFLSRFTLAPSPRDQYADSLRAANLHLSGMGADWLRAGDEALARPLTVTLPFRESAYFPADRPTATAFRLELKRGRRLEIDVQVDSVGSARLFVDVFEARGTDPPTRVVSLAEGTTLRYDVPRDGVYVLRVQPELLRSGRYTLVERTLASLRFPVDGLTAAAVHSEFGAEREAGRRTHEGIDIFAPRNTPVVAVVDGHAVPDTNNLGGNVVWLRDGRGRRSYYYAHLQRWAFEGSRRVTTGDVLGYVGNTGNARTTAPHLHFGIYEGGAIDPLPFIQADDPIPATSGHVDRLSQRVRVVARRAVLRSGAGIRAPEIGHLERESIGTVTGVAGSWLRLQLPDGTSGYLDNNAAGAATSSLRQRRVQAATTLRDHPTATAPALLTFDEATAVQVLGLFQNFELVRTANDLEGWIAVPGT